ncbi:hypothetical protein [Levilactobacillus koreensis]|uniref:Uncharacterized protein n=1 Tax=Levilactobacillus koreensis TaxID=637971 RepID=A0AAC8ZGR4_9LACO|nr:hypothetical protein ABN16_09370 [Levilactobacillus koreensis]
MSLFLDEQHIPSYFYEHAVHANSQLIHRLNVKYPQENLRLSVMELHFDGHNGDHLLVYIKVPSKHEVYLIDIGSHAEIFR